MKKVILILMAAMMMSLLTMAVAAQKPKARDLFIEKEKNETKGKSGTRVRILLKRGTEKERFVSPDTTFYSGDKIKLAFDINFSGYIAVLNVGSSGKISLLYPYTGANAKVEPNDEEQLIPQKSKDWIVFDDQPGTEQLTIVFSSNPIETIEKIIEMSKPKDADDSKTSKVEVSGNADATVKVTNNGNNNTVNITVTAEAQASLQELNKRSLKRSKSRDLFIQSSDDATYAVAEPGLITEPTAFVVNLKHEVK